MGDETVSIPGRGEKRNVLRAPILSNILSSSKRVGSGDSLKMITSMVSSKSSKMIRKIPYFPQGCPDKDRFSKTYIAKNIFTYNFD